MGGKQEHQFAEPFLLAIEGKGAPRDEIGGPLGLIRRHQTQVQHHRFLLPQRRNCR